MNFTRSGKSVHEASRVPRHSPGISRQASPRVFPSNGGETIRQSNPVSHASPKGSTKLDFSGYSGAREGAHQSRGLKIGSMRIGAGFTNQAAASAREKNRSKRRKPSSMRSIEVA